MLWNAFRLPFAASTLALITVAAASAATLKAAVADAAKITPPKNGKNYVFAFANLDRGITFCNKSKAASRRTLRLRASTSASPTTISTAQRLWRTPKAS